MQITRCWIRLMDRVQLRDAKSRFLIRHCFRTDDPTTKMAGKNYIVIIYRPWHVHSQTALRALLEDYPAADFN